MFAGNVGEAQDMPAIVEAAALTRDLPDLRWLIVGDGRAVGILKAEIARQGLEQRVILLGRHPVERMPSFMAGASALLVSLRAEPVFSLTLPGKVQNYLASGIPTIAMLDGEGARVVTSSGGGVVVRAGDGVALAEAVRKLSRLSPKARAAMGRRARSFAAASFDRDILFDDFLVWAEEASAGMREGAKGC
jgi:glycosyltransferase involved in cell wall biosynthesis